LAPYRLERRYRRLGFSSFLYHAIGHVWMIPTARMGMVILTGQLIKFPPLNSCMPGWRIDLVCIVLINHSFNPMQFHNPVRSPRPAPNVTYVQRLPLLMYLRYRSPPTPWTVSCWTTSSWSSFSRVDRQKLSGPWTHFPPASRMSYPCRSISLLLSP
jgi:hypothetical protein